MNWADWGIVGVVVLSSLISLKRGFVKEALSLLIWVAAFVVATWFSPAFMPYLEPYISVPSLRQMAAFAILFICALILGGAVNYLLSSLVKATGLSGTDRMLGVLFGFARGFLIVLVLVLYLPKIVPLVNQDGWWQQSALIPHFVDLEDKFHLLTKTVTDMVVQFL